MRIQRFITLAKDLLTAAEDPRIKSVAGFDEPGVNSFAGLKITFQDGSALYIRMVAVAQDGGDNFNEPEQIAFPDWEVPSNFKELVDQWLHAAPIAT